MRVCTAALLGFLCASSAWGQLTTTSHDVAYGTLVDLSPTDYSLFADKETLALHNFGLPDGRAVTIDLEAFTVLADNAELVVVTDEGQQHLADPAVALFRGEIEGESDSRVFLSVSPTTISGIIRTGRSELIISSGPVDRALPTLIFNPADVPDELLAMNPFVCHAEQLETLVTGHSNSQAPVGSRMEPCRLADIAIETDHEYRQLWGNNADASAYAVTLMGAISEIYKADTNVTFQITFLRLWDTAGDPWTEDGGTIDQLLQWRDYWNLNETGVSRHVAHFLSGRGLGGGVAYGDAACFPEYDYGLSANLGGAFPYPLNDNDNGNWDLIVVAHELGHNFGNPHTHDIGIDNCAGGDCNQASLGTLMSYCHTCPGGLANFNLNFHPTMLSTEMLPFLNSGQCSMAASAPTITDDPDSTTVCSGAGFALSALSTFEGNMSFQWYQNGSPIAGANTLTYSVASAGAGDAGSYTVEATNDCGSTTSAAAIVTICSGDAADINGDCIVDLSDLATLLANFGKVGQAPSDGDVTGDGTIDLNDLAQLLAAFGQGC